MTINYELNENLSITETGRLQLKSLSDDLLFYCSYDVSTNADYSIGDSIPTVSNSNTGFITSTGEIPFGKALKINDGTRILYSKDNFTSLTSEGSISFWVNLFELYNTGEEEVTIFEIVDTTDISDLSNRIYKIQLSYNVNDDIFSFSMNGDSGTTVINEAIPDLQPAVENNIFYHVELSWNSNLYQFFVNGVQSNLTPTGFERNNHGALIIHGTGYITIDDLVIRDKYQHLTNFTPPENAFSKYPIGNFEQEIPLGDSFEADRILDFYIEGDTSLKLILKHGDTYYNITNNSWQIIENPNYDNSSTIYQFKNNIQSFPFDGTKQVSIKVFFPSEGLTQVYLDNLIINKDLTKKLNTTNYNEVIRYIRAKLGDPIIPVELTDEQLSDCIDDTEFYYSRYKNSKEEMEIFDLQGNWSQGWELPDGVREEEVLEVFVDPTFPFGYYSGRTDIVANLYAQYIFQNPQSNNLSSGIADYRITLSTLKDYAILLGTQVKWAITGRRLKIWPEPPNGSKVGIRYASKLVAEDVLKDNMFKDLALAKAKIILGTIRSTFPGGIPGGEQVVQLNGESLLQEGKQEEQAAMQALVHAQEPLFLDFF